MPYEQTTFSTEHEAPSWGAWVGQPADGGESQCQVLGFWHGPASTGLSQPVAQVQVPVAYEQV
jgi:hypothetical protein